MGTVRRSQTQQWLQRRWMHRHGRSIAGFTLLEILVVIIIIAILFAISAPAWDAVMNRQRVGAAREQIVQTMRQAQADARRSKTPKAVVFDAQANGPLRVAVVSRPVSASGAIDETPATVPDGSWTTLGNGEIQAGSLRMATLPAMNSGRSQIVFDGNGAVAPASANANGSVNAGTEANRVIFRVTVGATANSAGANRCVIVKTILGAMQLAEGATNCPS
jgi:prepilin-type N-terminal cleavage/methylation domain-containing protein